MNIKMKNYEILAHAEQLNQAFEKENSTQYLPIKLSFFIQRNRKNLNDIAENINTCKNQIIRTFGTSSKEDPNLFVFEGESEQKANKEFSDLMNVSIDVEVHTIKLADISSDAQISNQQMEAILFMIEE